MLRSSSHIRAFTLFCFFGAILSLVRVWITGWPEYIGFVWNLILALVPYFFAAIAVTKRGIIHWLSAFFWFIFFPNSLYIWTDFVHLGEYPDMLHFDIVYISVMAIAGLVCGFASLEIMQNYWSKKYNKRMWWLLVTLAMIIGIYGVYIGRFLRLNSWDLLDSPLLVIREIWNLTLSNGNSLLITESHRIAEVAKYSLGMMNLSTFVILYTSFFLMIYASIYHTKRDR